MMAEFRLIDWALIGLNGYQPMTLSWPATQTTMKALSSLHLLLMEVCGKTH